MEGNEPKQTGDSWLREKASNLHVKTQGTASIRYRPVMRFNRGEWKVITHLVNKRVHLSLRPRWVDFLSGNSKKAGMR